MVMAHKKTSIHFIVLYFIVLRKYVGNNYSNSYSKLQHKSLTSVTFLESKLVVK